MFDILNYRFSNVTEFFGSSTHLINFIAFRWKLKENLSITGSTQMGLTIL